MQGQARPAVHRAEPDRLPAIIHPRPDISDCRLKPNAWVKTKICNLNSEIKNHRRDRPMKREFPELPLVGVGAIIIEGSRVLLVKRAHPPLQAQWSIPGGVLEVGELIREAAIREAREETGLTVEPSDLLGVYDRIL